MIIPIIVSAAPANWALAKQIKARLDDAGHQGVITPWMGSIPDNEGVVIYIGRADNSVIAATNRTKKQVRVIAVNAEKTTIYQIDWNLVFGKAKPTEDLLSAPKRKPGRPRSQ